MSYLTLISLLAGVLICRYFDVTAATAFMFGAGSMLLAWFADKCAQERKNRAKKIADVFE